MYILYMHNYFWTSLHYIVLLTNFNHHTGLSHDSDSLWSSLNYHEITIDFCLSQSLQTGDMFLYAMSNSLKSTNVDTTKVQDYMFVY